MTTLIPPSPAVKPTRRREPLACALTMHINAVGYTVTTIDAGACGTKAFRLAKLSGDGDTVYDVIRTHEGLVECDCPSYECTYRGNGFATCKHGQALVMLGLLEAPRVEAPTNEAGPPGGSSPAAPRETPVGEESLRPTFSVPAHSVKPSRRPFDRPWYIAQNAVAEGRALWLPADTGPATACAPAPAPEAEPALPDLDAFTDDDEPPALDWPGELTLAELADHEALGYRAWGTEAGDLFARTMETLAERIRATDATTPADYLDRHATLLASVA